MGQPTPPIAFASAPTERRNHVASASVELTSHVLDALAATGATVHVDAASLMEASRDWWPLAMQWAADGEVVACASAVVQPTTTEQIRAVLEDLQVDRMAEKGRALLELAIVRLQEAREDRTATVLPFPNAAGE